MDKVFHFFVSSALYCLVGWEIALSIGLAKEIYDFTYYSTLAECSGDFAFDILGVVISNLILK